MQGTWASILLVIGIQSAYASVYSVQRWQGSGITLAGPTRQLQSTCDTTPFQELKPVRTEYTSPSVAVRLDTCLMGFINTQTYLESRVMGVEWAGVDDQVCGMSRSAPPVVPVACTQTSNAYRGAVRSYQWFDISSRCCRAAACSTHMAPCSKQPGTALLLALTLGFGSFSTISEPSNRWHAACLRDHCKECDLEVKRRRQHIRRHHRTLQQ